MFVPVLLASRANVDLDVAVATSISYFSQMVYTNHFVARSPVASIAFVIGAPIDCVKFAASDLATRLLNGWLNLGDRLCRGANFGWIFWHDRVPNCHAMTALALRLSFRAHTAVLAVSTFTHFLAAVIALFLS